MPWFLVQCTFVRSFNSAHLKFFAFLLLRRFEASPARPIARCSLLLAFVGLGCCVLQARSTVSPSSVSRDPITIQLLSNALQLSGSTTNGVLDTKASPSLSPNTVGNGIVTEVVYDDYRLADRMMVPFHVTDIREHLKDSELFLNFITAIAGNSSSILL
jgi:hypothetical protein